MVAASSSALVIRCGKSFHRSSTSWDPPGAAATRSARAPKMIQCNSFMLPPGSFARNLALCRRWWYKSRRDMSPPADVQRQRRASSHKYTASFASRAALAIAPAAPTPRVVACPSCYISGCSAASRPSRPPSARRFDRPPSETRNLVVAQTHRSSRGTGRCSRGSCAPFCIVSLNSYKLVNWTSSPAPPLVAFSRVRDCWLASCKTLARRFAAFTQPRRPCLQLKLV